MSSFATYPLTDTLAGTGLADNLAADGQYFAIFTDGHHRQLPRLTGGPFKYKTFASQYVEKAMKMATKPLKQAVIAPSMLALLYPLDGEVKGYTREQFLSDLVDQCEKDIRRRVQSRRQAGLDRLHRRAARLPRTTRIIPWTGRKMLGQLHRPQQPGARSLQRPRSARTSESTPAPGATAMFTHSADVDYAELAAQHV